MVWLGARARCFHNEVRRYLPTQYIKIEFGTFCQVIAAPPSGFREGIRREFRRGMFHIFVKKFHFGTPHLLDFQVAAWWLGRLYACFRKVAPLACNRCIVVDLCCDCEACSLDAPGVVTPDTAPDISEPT